MKISRIILLLVLGMASCSEELFEPTCTGTTPTFTTNVLPIIQANCATSNCHNSGSSKGPGALTTHAQISAAKSRISSSIRNGSMPKQGSLTTNEKNQILCWIEAGALNN